MQGEVLTLGGVHNELREVIVRNAGGETRPQTSSDRVVKAIR